MGNYHTKYDRGDTVYWIASRSHHCNCCDCAQPKEIEVVEKHTVVRDIRLLSNGQIVYDLSTQGHALQVPEELLYSTEFEAIANMTTPTNKEEE